MKILVVHNSYRERGGEDAVVEAEKAMLEHFGHEVILYQRSNDEISRADSVSKIRFFLKDIYWSRRTYEQLRDLIAQHKPQLAHVHNTFYAISPSVYQACRDARLPVVQTLHNYRWMCPAGTFFRNGRNCEDCVQSGKVSAVLHRCCQRSLAVSSSVAYVLGRMKPAQLLAQDGVHAIAPSEFSRKKFVEAGFPQQKISVKPNFVDIPFKARTAPGRYALFIGRLADYKGVRVLIDAFEDYRMIPLKIIGDGPLDREARAEAGDLAHVEFLGALPQAQSLAILREAAFLVFPSVCYETFGRVIIEAFACGVPVIASDAGAARELVLDGETGFLFASGKPESLAEKISELVRQPQLLDRMGHKAREVYEERFTMERNHAALIDIYNKACR